MSTEHAGTLGKPPEIPQGENRSVTDLWPKLICGCGRKTRYISCTEEPNTHACNKYGRCMSWDELKAKYDELREAAKDFADEPLCRNTYTLNHHKRARLTEILSR